MNKIVICYVFAIALFSGHPFGERNNEYRNIQAQHYVRVSKGGIIMVHGKPFFPIGCYNPPQGTTYHELAKAGFNLVQCDAKISELDKAHDAGLKVWISSLAGELDFSNDADRKKTRIREKVDALKEHPALLVWESRDEPAWTWKEPAKPAVPAAGLTQGHEFLKSLDKNHPIWINHAPRNLVKTLIKFSRGTDIVSCDIYPIIPCGIREMYAIENGFQGDLLNQTASAVGEYTRKMRKVAGADRSVWMVLQAFAWEATREADEQDSSKILYPTYEQLRFMAYDAVINGANGILFFGTHTLNRQSPLWSDLKRVVKELSDMSHVFLTTTLDVKLHVEYTELGYSMDTVLEFLVKDYKGKVYIVAANTSPYPAQVTVSGFKSLTSSNVLEVFNEHRSLSCKEGAFTDYFKGFGVHVYVSK